jgi:hypothetical protein
VRQRLAGILERAAESGHWKIMANWHNESVVIDIDFN